MAIWKKKNNKVQNRNSGEKNQLYPFFSERRNITMLPIRNKKPPKKQYGDPRCFRCSALGHLVKYCQKPRSNYWNVPREQRPSGNALFNCESGATGCTYCYNWYHKTEDCGFLPDVNVEEEWINDEKKGFEIDDDLFPIAGWD
jgi:hypothetical protein